MIKNPDDINAIKTEFARFDKDGNGRIDYDEFVELLAAIGPRPTEEEAQLAYSVIDANSEVVHTTEISIPKGVMMHDCAITKRYTLFLDLPITFDFERAMRGESMLAWEPENGSRIGVVPRMGGDAEAKWFEIDT